MNLSITDIYLIDCCDFESNHAISIWCLKLVLLREADIAISGDVFVLLRHRLQINLAFSIEDYLCNLAVEVVDGCPQPLFQFLRYKTASECPFLERFSNQIVSVSFQSIVIVQFDLVVIRIEYHTVLNNLYLFAWNLILSN